MIELPTGNYLVGNNIYYDYNKALRAYKREERLARVITTIVRVMFFPVMLLVRLYDWTYKK